MTDFQRLVMFLLWWAAGALLVFAMVVWLTITYRVIVRVTDPDRGAPTAGYQIPMIVNYGAYVAGRTGEVKCPRG